MPWYGRRRRGYSSDEGRSDEAPDETEIFSDGKWPFGGVGGPDAVPMPIGTVCNEISAALARAEENAGEFSFGGSADTLPSMPGLFVDGVGSIPLPLGEDAAQKLIAVCEKSPFGRKLDTLMDENVRKSWQLQPSQVDIRNPLWQQGMEKLSVTIADRLGYKDVPLQCLMYKLLVYGEGGHFVKHQDTEKENGMVATLVVQLPTLHEGGDLVVYRGKDVKYRHDFGKKEGTAAYRPHYAVHYADAEHALETVTSGYRLVLVYSICLPPTMRHLQKDLSRPVSEELAAAVNRMQGGDDAFALLLSHEYTQKSIEDLGSGALKGVDRARFQALEEANFIVAGDKKLHFFIAQLSHDVHYWEDGRDTGSWQEDRRDETITWYSTSGKSHGQSETASLKESSFGGANEEPEPETVQLNFLNPGRESLSNLWKIHGSSTFEGYLGNEGATRNTTYSRFAIVAWPAVQAVENALKFINVDAATGALQSQKPVNAAALRTFMEAVSAKLAEPNSKRSWRQTNTVSVGLCRGLCELLVDAGDASLANTFFVKFFSALSDQEHKEALVPSIIALARTFDWSDVGQAVVSSLDTPADDDVDTPYFRYTRVPKRSVHEIVLQLVDGLDQGPAQRALLSLAIDKVAQLSDEVLCSSKSLDVLWKCAINCGDDSIFEAVANKFKQVNPRLLRPVIDAFSQQLSGVAATDDKFAVLSSIAALRIHWLSTQLQAQGQPFSWEMPDAQFPDNAHVQAFLRGPRVSMDTMGVRSFNGIQHARNYANKWMREKQINASFELEPEGRGRDAYVVITKTRTWFSKHQKELLQYQSERQHLMDQYGATTTSASTTENQRKRRREVWE